MKNFCLEPDITIDTCELDKNLCKCCSLPSQKRLRRVIDNTTALACANSLDAEQSGQLTYQAKGISGIDGLLIK